MFTHLFLVMLSWIPGRDAPASLSGGDSRPFAERGKGQIAVQNALLATVNETTISVVDVKKRLDMLFYQHYAHLSDSEQARYQFYLKSWRPVLMEMIDNALILADAADRMVNIPDSEVREAMEERFGANLLGTLDGLGLTYDEASKMMKNDLIVQRMQWWFIQSKAVQSVTPKTIREAYQKFVAEHPPYEELKYRIVSMRGEGADKEIESVYQILIQEKASPELLVDKLLEVNPSIQVSPEYAVSSLEISEAHRSVLSSMNPGSYSLPVVQNSRVDHRAIFRIFYLKEKTDHPVSNFKEMSASLREQLIQQFVVQHGKEYVQKLRKNYGFNPEFLKDTLPEELQPFSFH